jgi:soluble P-type ATPase
VKSKLEHVNQQVWFTQILKYTIFVTEGDREETAAERIQDILMELKREEVRPVAEQQREEEVIDEVTLRVAMTAAIRDLRMIVPTNDDGMNFF